MRIPALLLVLTVAVTANAAITGSIADADSKPIAGATVRAYAAEGSAATRARLIAGKLEREPVASVKSAENGSFSIELKTPAAVDVVIEAPSYSPAIIPTVDGDDLGVIVLNAPSTRTIRVTSGGKPVANAFVISGLDVLRTNASGEVRAGSGNYVVVHPDYAITRSTASVTEIKLTRGVAVRGRVVKGADPVAHAVVSINGWPLAETGDDGTFAIAHAPENWQSVTALRGNDLGSANRPKSGSVEIRLNAGSTFTGNVRDVKRGGAVAGARMTMTGPNDTSLIALSDAKGNVTFGPLFAGINQISGMHPAFSIESANVTLPATRSRAVAAQAFARANGRVLDEAKKPIAGAVVSSGRRSALTNPSGEFALRVQTGSTFPIPLFASKRDYVSGASPARVWQAGEVRDNIVITLTHGFVAQVRVLDRHERPVSNAIVNVTHSASANERSLPIACADPSLPDCRRTNADGLVAVRTSEGRHDVMVLGDDVAPVRTPNQLLTARAATVVVHVDRGVEISGRVVLADGTPVPDVIVETPTGIMPRQATSGPDGTFKIAGVAPGASTVRAYSSDRRLSSTPVPVTAPASDVTITMPRGARIEGRVFDRATQQPVTDFSILLPSRGQPGIVRPDSSSFAGGPAIHADDGHYALDNVPPGTMQLMVNATGYVVATRGDITVEDGKTVTGIDIALDRGANVSGRVTSGGAPVAGAQVRLAAQHSPNFSNPTTDADGLYTLNGVSEGDQTIVFQKTGFIVLNKQVSVTAGKDIRVDAELDPGRELRGRVVDHSGQPVVGAYVATVTTDGRPNVTVTSDGDGNFVLQGLADGRYKVTARKEGFVSSEASDVVLPQAAPLTLTMDSGATINGRITGIPPEQFTRVVVTASGNTTRNQTWVDASGNFSLPGMPDGRVRVDAFLEGNGQRRNANKSIEIANGVAPQVELNFEEGITVSGHVTHAGNVVTTGSLAFMPKMQSPRSVSPSTQRTPVSAMISADGSYIATGLSAGDYDVRVNAPGISYSTPYTAAANGTFDIDIRGALLRGRVVDASSNAGVPNARVNVTSRVPSFGSATSDSDGRFTIDALADGTYNLQVISDQYAPSPPQQIVVSNGTVPDVEVRLEQAPAMVIHVVDSTTGSPVDGNVAVMDAAHRYSGTATRIDSGTFKVWLKPGTYNVSAYARGYIAKTSTLTTPPAEATISLDRGGTLVVRAHSAQQVRLDVPGGRTQRFLGPLQPGTNGPYESLPAGSYLLSTVGTDRTVLRSVPVTIVAGETVTIDLP